MERVRMLVILSILLILCAAPSMAETRVITLDEPGGSACYDVWTEAGCAIRLENTTGADCNAAGVCLFNGDLWPGGLYFPYRMFVDLGAVSGVESVEIDVYDGWEIGCVQAWLYSDQLLLDQAASTSVGGWFTITLTTQAVEATELIVSGWDGAVDEIRLVGTDITAAGASSWGTLKALY